jgi:hypothetical protein
MHETQAQVERRWCRWLLLGLFAVTAVALPPSAHTQGQEAGPISATVSVTPSARTQGQESEIVTINGAAPLRTTEERAQLPVSATVQSSAGASATLSFTLSLDRRVFGTIQQPDARGKVVWRLPSDASQIKWLAHIERGAPEPVYDPVAHTLTVFAARGLLQIEFVSEIFIKRENCTLTFAGAYQSSQDLWQIVFAYPAFYADALDPASVEPGADITAPGSLTWLGGGPGKLAFSARFNLSGCVEQLNFPSGNRSAHHTEDWPDFTFRRAQSLIAEATLQRDFTPETHTLRWEVKTPNSSTFGAISTNESRNEWWVREGPLMESESGGPASRWTRADTLHIPPTAPIGTYVLRASAYRNVTVGSMLLNSEQSPTFYVIFNPWNDDGDAVFDADMHHPALDAQSLAYYAEDIRTDGLYGGVGHSDPLEWNLGQNEEAVFLAAMESVEGRRTALQVLNVLVDRVRWVRERGKSSESPLDVIEARWPENLAQQINQDSELGPCSPFFLRSNWKDVPQIIAAWNKGSNHPCGQCMDMTHLLVAYARAVGIPARSVTCIKCFAPDRNDTWNFHLWTELWLPKLTPGDWSTADSTQEIYPQPRTARASNEGLDFVTQVKTATNVWVMDPKHGQVDLLSKYRGRQTLGLHDTSWPGEVGAADAGDVPVELSGARATSPTTQLLALAVQTTKPAYHFGESVQFNLSASNDGSNPITVDLQPQVALTDYSGSAIMYGFPPRSRTIPAGGRVVEAYELGISAYKLPGSFVVTATVGTASVEAAFAINSALRVQVSAPDEVMEGGEVEYAIAVENTLPTPSAPAQLFVSLPPSAGGIQPVVDIPTLAPQARFTRAGVITVPRPGLQHLSAVVTTEAGDYAIGQAAVSVLRTADVDVQIEASAQVATGTTVDVLARVRNRGDRAADDVALKLRLGGALRSSQPVTVEVGALAPGAEQVVIWPVTVTGTGVHFVEVTANDRASGDSERSGRAVIGIEAPSELLMTATHRAIYGRTPTVIGLTLVNPGLTPHPVEVRVVSNNPAIGFNIVHQGKPMTSPIMLPAQGRIDLTLTVNPAWDDGGLISVSAISTHDPTARRELLIPVQKAATTWLPLMRHP